MMSERLNYQPVALETLDDFHRLVQDDHVRRFLMDGRMFPREWSEERVRDSDNLFEQRGVGLWLAYEKGTEALVGFCGFLRIPSIHPEPQLVYALLERFTGAGYATEMARAVIAQARRQPAFAQIVASVDEANVASARVLEKLGFQRIATQPGSFGNVLVFVLRRATETQSTEPG